MALGVMTGCQNQNEIPAIEPLEEEAVKTVSETVKLKPDFIEGEDYDELGGADSYNFLGDNATSRFYVNPDFYRLKSDETLTLIEGFKTMQQTTEWSCGNAVSLMTLWNIFLSFDNCPILCKINIHKRKFRGYNRTLCNDFATL